jgi:hypothetical protein
MKFAPKFFLAILTCLAGSQLAYCSQAQTTPMAVDQGSPATLAEQKQAVAQAVLQATTQTAAQTSQTTGQEIVEREPKRQKICSEEEAKKENEDPELQAVLDLMPKEQRSWYECGMKAFKLKYAKESLKANRGSVLDKLLYALLDPMPNDLILIILDYEASKFYVLQVIPDCSLYIRTLQKSTLDVIVPLSNSAFAMGFNDGTLSIDQETGPQGKKQWELQTIQAHTKAITTIVDLPFQRIATGSTDEELKIWELHKEKLQYACTKTIATGIKIKKMAPLPDGNIVILGEKDNEDILKIFDPQTQTYVLLYVNDNIDFLFVLPNGNILYEHDDNLSLAMKQTTNTHEVQQWERFCCGASSLRLDYKALCSLPNNTIIMLTSAFNDELQQIYIWNQKTDDWKVVLQQDTDRNQIHTIAVLRDGRIAIAFNTHIDICHIKNNTMDDGINLDRNGSFHHLITLSDGRLLAASKEGKIQIWK